MKRVFNFFYILSIFVIYFALLCFFLLSIFHLISRFPPKPIAVFLFLSVALSFFSLMKVFYSKPNLFYLVISIVTPVFLLLSPLYYMIPILAKAMPILEEYMILNGGKTLNLHFVFKVMEITIENHNFFSLDHISKLFFHDMLPFLMSTVTFLSIYSIGNYRKYIFYVRKANVKPTGSPL